MPLVVQTRLEEESNDALAALAIPVWLKASHVVSYALLVVVNAGASLGWVGETNADVSKKWPVPITPAGYAFSIWGLIFFLQGVGAIYTFLNVGYNRESHEKEHAVKAACWVQAVWLSQDLWQIAFSKESFHISFFLIASACAFGVYSVVRLHAARDAVGAFSALTSAGISIPTSINSSWLLAATCVQLLITLKSDGMSEGKLSTVAVALVVMAALVAVGAVLVLSDLAWGLTAVWALVAIALNNKDEQPAVFTACVVAVSTIVVSVAFSAVRRKMQMRSPTGGRQFVQNPISA
ncbi:hypothetical protein PPROV_000307400 [Pycnococcus provasolii]|uniref:Transmembrane protein n=1 Tax=Pycnococcus provasolii TaxID=41880 RepID=A0A830HET8_9CHLO|nr:hypothetical protein PPROV_000307400 [Pycnococcus provasolii]